MNYSSNKKDYVSYSQYKMWTECGHRYKLVYKEKVPFYSSNEYTAFGTAIHETCEKVIFGNENKDPNDFFLESFEESRKDIEEPNEKLASEMIPQAKKILECVHDAVDNYFGKRGVDYEVGTLEEELFVPIRPDLSFKGYIDMVVMTPDGKYHIIDWKTCSWGWNARKKSSKLMTYQLTLYKEYFCKKHDIDPKNVETYFALLKRTAKKDNVEIFRVTSGERKTENALKALNNFIYNCDKSVYFKNRLSCKYCSFYKTEHCR